MRKDTKSRILDVVKTIFSAHDDIEKLLKKGITANAATLLGDCQDAVISVGEIIQNSEGEDHKAISLIENYCRILFDFYNALNEGKEYDSSCKTLNRLLTDIKKCIEKDIRGKIEVVFMPYKASMWDSLESVWKAADGDPDCDAYVVPIPYYDRNPDHSFGEFHYEGDQFPDYVPVTHYMNYDERKRKPDVIYIHNPYDDCNYVTSVDPRFYSDQLMKCTDCLVYIPYFVLNENKNMSNIEHYVLSPAVMNADYVVVQSEKVKEKYLEYILKYANDKQTTKEIFRKKILGVGSPKFDAIEQERPSFDSLPVEWKKIIGDENRKIILYNTHLSLFMKGTAERAFIKLSNVFELFRRRKDVVLLWRPHPLTITTIRSMNPSVYERYIQLVEEYKKDGFGIYDDTPYMDMAIAVSDAYYGSTSSMVPIYKATGKPVLIHDINIISDFSEEI